MTGQEIITDCLKAIGETDTASPVEISRADCLKLVNFAYQEVMGPLLNYQKSTSLSVSDAKVTLPSDYLEPVRVYDGSNWYLQIFDIADKDSNLYQYWIPNETEIHFTGKVPTTITLYYKAKPTALDDTANTKPDQLKTRFHDKFSVYVKATVHKRRDMLSEYFSLEGQWQNILREIRTAHSIGRHDKEPPAARVYRAAE